MHPAVERVKTEGRKVLVTTVFFSLGFLVLVLHNRLLVEGSQIQIASYARAIFGGLIVAKVLLGVDMLPFFDAFPRKPMIYNIEVEDIALRSRRYGLPLRRAVREAFDQRRRLVRSPSPGVAATYAASDLGNFDLGGGSPARVVTMKEISP